MKSGLVEDERSAKITQEMTSRVCQTIPEIKFQDGVAGASWPSPLYIVKHKELVQPVPGLETTHLISSFVSTLDSCCKHSSIQSRARF